MAQLCPNVPHARDPVIECILIDCLYVMPVPGIAHRPTIYTQKRTKDLVLPHSSACILMQASFAANASLDRLFA